MGKGTTASYKDRLLTKKQNSQAGLTSLLDFIKSFLGAKNTISTQFYRKKFVTQEFCTNTIVE